MKMPSKTREGAFSDCFDAVGDRSAASALQITSINRGMFKTWLVANGVASVTASAMPLATLREVWADTTDAALAMWQANIPAIKPVAAPSSDSKADASDSKESAAAKALRDLIGASALDEKRVIELIKLHSVKTIRTEILLPGGRVSTLSDQPHHSCFPELLAAVAAGLNVLLVGPAGSGKTHVCEQVAKALGLSYGYTGAIAAEHKIMGFMNAMGEAVRTAYRDKYENGGVFLFDEMDGSSAAALLAFNAGLANGSQDFPGGIVSRHADFRCIASANTFGTGANAQYVGRNQLDAATLDRFYVIPMGYDAAMEAAVYGDGPVAPVSLYKPVAGAASDWMPYVHKVRASVERLGLRHIVSGRAIASGQKALAAGIPRASVERAVLWKSLDAGTIAKIKAAA